jgi:outer membrane protein TolC
MPLGARIGAIAAVSISILLSVPLAPSWAGDQGPEVFDLKGCLEYAEKNSVSMQVSDADRVSKQLEVDYQETDFWPRIDVSASTGYLSNEGVPILAVGSGQLAAGAVEYWYYSVSVGVSVPILQKGVLIGSESPSVAEARADLEKSDHAYKAARAKMTYDVTAAYFTTLKYVEEITLREESVRAMRVHRETAFDKHRLELVPLNDLLAAEVKLAEAERDLATARNNLAYSLADLANVMGFAEPRGIAVTYAPEADLSLPDVNEMVRAAHQSRPEVMMQEAETKKANAALALARSEKYPVVKFTTGLTGTDDYDPPVNKVWTASVTFDMPLIDFGASVRKIMKAEADIAVSEKTLRQVKGDISKEVLQTHTSFKNNEARLPALKKGVVKAHEALRTAEEKYRQDIVPQASVLDAENAVATARKALLDAQFEMRIAYAAARKAVGQ